MSQDEKIHKLREIVKSMAADQCAEFHESEKAFFINDRGAWVTYIKLNNPMAEK